MTRPSRYHQNTGPSSGMSATRAVFGGHRLSFAAIALLLAACSRSPQQREADHMQRGKDYAAGKQYSRAVIEFKIASQNMPKDPEPLYQRGMVYLAAGGWRLAVELFRQTLALNPKHEGASYQLALLEVLSSQPDLVERAERSLRQYINVHSRDEGGLSALAIAEAKLGNKHEVLATLDRLADAYPKNLRPAALAVAVYSAKGDLSVAREIALRMEKKLPSSPDAAVLRAQVALAMEDSAGTEAQIARALSLNSEFVPALQLRLHVSLGKHDQAAAEETARRLSHLADTQVSPAYARLLFSEGKIGEGSAEFERLLKANGNSVTMRDEYAALLMSAGRNGEAEIVVEPILKQNPKDPVALLVRATIRIDKGNFTDADRDLADLRKLKAAAGDNTFLNVRSVSSQLSYQQSRIYAGRGDFIRQGDLLEDALRSDPHLLIARIDLSRLLITSGKASTALKILDDATAGEKNRPEFLLANNAALIASGDWSTARKSVTAAMSFLSSPTLLYQDAVIRARAQDPAGARKSLESAFRLSPTNPGVLKFLGQMMRQQDEAGNFIKMLKEAAETHPHSATLLIELGHQLELQRDLQGARRAFEGAQSAGDVVSSGEQLALLDIESGALDTAKQRLLGLIKTHDTATFRVVLANIELRKGDNDAAIGHYLKALQLEPSNALAMNNVAELLSRKGKLDDALFYAQKALVQTQENAISEDTLGWINFRMGKYPEAVVRLEHSVKSMDRAIARYHLAAALLKSGNPEQGLTEYQLAVASDPQSSARKDVRALFESPKH